MSAWLAAAALYVTRPERLRQFREARDRQWESAEQIEVYRTAKLRRSLHHALDRVPYYRELAGGLTGLVADDPHAVLAALPTVDNATILAAPEAFLAEGVRAARRVAQTTGGSTGTVFSFYLDLADREIRTAIDMRGRTWAGWRLGDRQAWLWGHAGDVKSRGRLGGRIRNALVNRTLTVNCFDLSPAKAESALRELRAYGPRLLVGYASALAYLAAVAGPGRPLPGLRGVISSAETLQTEQREAIEETFGVPVLNRYGSREFGTVAQQCEAGAGLHLSAERLVWEVLDPEGRPCPPGQRGELVLTDLDNRVMPLIRYRTGDIAVPAGGPCPCGRGLPVLAEVEGRISDLLVGRNGRVIACPGPTFFLGGLRTVKQLQIRQQSLDLVEMIVVPATGWDPADRARLGDRMRALLGEIEVRFVEVEHIPPTASGKYRFSVSAVSPFRPQR